MRTVTHLGLAAVLSLSTLLYAQEPTNIPVETPLPKTPDTRQTTHPR